MGHIDTKTLFIIYLNIFCQSSLLVLVDSIFGNSPILLKCICNLKTNTHSPFSIIHRTAKNWVGQVHVPSWGWTSGALPSYSSSLTIHSVVWVAYVVTGIFLLVVVILLFNMAPKYRAKCCLVFLTKLWCTFWRKYLCSISFIYMLPWVIALLSMGSMSINQLFII